MFCVLLTAFTALISGAVLGACSEIPSVPSERDKVTGVSVAILQNDLLDSTSYKINSNDSAQIIAFVHPDKFAEKLHYYWYHEDEFLDSGSTYSVTFMIKKLIPNRLVVIDDQENSLETAFDIVLNAPPRIGASMIPADSTVFHQDFHTPILFRWYTYDHDDAVTSTFILDGEEYDVGYLTQITESGFEEGEHTYQVIVTDSHGDQAVSPKRVFFVEPEDS